MKRIAIGLALIILVALPNTKACTVLIAGKNTTVDGSILFAKTEDDGKDFQLDYLWKIPGKQYAEGSFRTLVSGLRIPQVSETYAYFIDECPQTHFSNMIINEWGVAFGSNGCASKEDANEILEKRGKIVDGGIGFDLRFILAERAKSAKEAVLLAAELLSAYGYNSSGRNLNIVDQHEAWQLQMVAGKHFVARKVQDDEVVVIANTFSIREVEINDKENFIYSPDLIEYAIKRGWYDPEGGRDFDFATAYAPLSAHTSNSNTHRQWMMAHLLNKDFSISLEQAEKGMMPVSVIPDRKLSLNDIMEIFRNHYEGTPLDKSNGYEISPHYTLQTICRYTTHRTTIVQQRSNLPADIGTVCWRALGEPCNSVFVPWYLGIDKIPEAYRSKEVPGLSINPDNFVEYHFNIPSWKIEQIDLNSAAKSFWLLGQLADNNYTKNHQFLRVTFRGMEAELIHNQKQFELKALELYKKDRSEAIELITNYTSEWAVKAYESSRMFINQFSIE